MNDELQEFFYREMNDQSHYEGDVIDWDDCSQGAVEFDAYDP